MIQQDRELLAELVRLNSEMPSLTLLVMDSSTSTSEQQNYAQCLIAAGERLQRRINVMDGVVIEGQVLATGVLAFPTHTVDPRWEARAR